MRGFGFHHSTIESDPKPNCVPIFGALGQRFTTIRELQGRSFYLKLALKLPTSKLSGRGKMMSLGIKNWYAVGFWVKLNGGVEFETKKTQKFGWPNVRVVNTMPGQTFSLEHRQFLS